MASLIENLIEVIVEETGCYKLLLKMADNKKDVIIKGDLPSLQTMTKDEQELAGLLLRLEKKRVGIIEDIAMVTNHQVQEMTITKLIKILEGQKEQQALIEAKDALVDVVLPLRDANRRNEDLIKQSIEFVDFTMNALQSAKQPLQVNTYSGAKTSSYPNMQKASYFDTKR